MAGCFGKLFVILLWQDFAAGFFLCKNCCGFHSFLFNEALNQCLLQGQLYLRLWPGNVVYCGQGIWLQLVLGSLECVSLACFRFANRFISLMVEAGFLPSLMVHKQSGWFGNIAKNVFSIVVLSCCRQCTNRFPSDYIAHDFLSVVGYSYCHGCSSGRWRSSDYCPGAKRWRDVKTAHEERMLKGL